jgi:hypothetical protein
MMGGINLQHHVLIVVRGDEAGGPDRQIANQFFPFSVTCMS